MFNFNIYIKMKEKELAAENVAAENVAEKAVAENVAAETPAENVAAETPAENEFGAAKPAEATSSQENFESSQVFSDESDFKAIADKLRKENPALVRLVTGAIINNVDISTKEGEFGDYRLLTITLNKNVRTFADTGDKDEFGEPVFAETVSNQIWILENQILACMGQAPGTLMKRKAKELKRSTDAKVIDALLGCTINICQLKVAEGEEFKNPFAKRGKTIIIPHNSWYNNVCLFQPSKELVIESKLKLISENGGQIPFSEVMAMLD